MSLALEGIKVVDLSQVAAVPMTARLLGDLGANVIHIEHPVRGDSCRAFQAGQRKETGVQSEVHYIWENYNRNKRSVTVDLTKEAGRAIIYKMLEDADVFLTNLRPYEIERYQMGYDLLSSNNQRLVYGSLSGLGKNGPEKDSPGYDHTLYWARSGIPHRLAPAGMALFGFVGGLGDNIAGMALAQGIMTALYVREKTGVGQEVDVSLFHCGVYQLSWDIAGALITGEDLQQVERGEGSALFTCYQTQDGRWLRLGIIRPDRFWGRFCKAIEREDLEHDPRFETTESKRENHADLFKILESVFLSKPLAEWRIRLGEAQVPWSPIQNLPEVVNDPQARANNFYTGFDHPTYGSIEVISNPVNLSKTPASVRLPAPELGQHTEEVLLEHGYTWEDIIVLKDEGVI